MPTTKTETVTPRHTRDYLVPQDIYVMLPATDPASKAKANAYDRSRALMNELRDSIRHHCRTCG